MPTDLRSLLASGRTLIGDGAMGTMLQRHGLPVGACAEMWNVEHPDVVRFISAAYVEAGAAFVQTNTFGANRIRLGHHGLAAYVVKLNQEGVRLAQEAAERSWLIRVASGAEARPVSVLASMGPAGTPADELEFDEARSVYAEQALAIASADADGIILETFTDLDELRVALAAVRAATKLSIFATMSCCLGRRSLNEANAAEAAKVLTASGAEAIGVNCNVPDECLPVLLEMRVAVETPLIARPHAGLPRVVNGEFVYDLTPPMMADYAVQFRDLGVRIIGGCCGTTPAHIRAMAEAVNSK